MLTCILLSLAIQPKTFDFDHKGAPVARVVEAMAEAFGEELKADGTMSRDYVIVAFRDATAGRARELLAETLNASWIEDDGKLILHRSRAQELEDERTDLRVQTRFVRAMQEEIEVPDRLVGEKAREFFRTLLEAPGAVASFLERMQEREALRAKLPGGRAVARLAKELKELDAEFLASLPLGVPVTFSVTGGFGTRRLPNSARPILAEFVQDQNDLMSLLELRAATAAPIAGMGRVSSNVQDVRVTITWTRTRLAVRLTSPKIAEQSYVDISLTFEAPTDLLIGEKEWPDGLDGLLELSAISLEQTWLRPASIRGAASPDQPSEELLDVYLNPKEHDFLELAISEIIIQAADQSGKSFVVVPHDWLLDPRLSRYKEISIKYALDLMFVLLYEQDQLVDAVVLTPMTPLQARQERVGRREFAASLKAFRERSRDTLTPLADLVGSCATIRAPEILWSLSVLSRTVPTIDGHGSLDLLSFYAKMNDGERGRARAGGAIFWLRDMDEERLALLESIYGFRLDRLGNRHWGLWMRRAEVARDGRGKETRWLRDIGTSGVAIRVQTVRQTTPFFRMLEDGPGTTTLQPTSMGRLSFTGAAAEQAGLPVPNTGFVYRIVEEQGILMSVISGGSEVHLTSYFVPAIYEGDEMVAFDDLPESFLDQYQAALEVELRKLQDPPRLSAVQRALRADGSAKIVAALRFPPADRRIRLTRQ